MNATRVILIVAAFTFAAAAGWAQTTSRQQVAELEQAKRELAAKSITTKGAGWHKLAQEQSKVQGLIDDLEAGKKVDPSRIDRVLQDAEKQAQ